MFKKSNLKIHPTKQIKSPVKNEIYFMKIYTLETMLVFLLRVLDLEPDVVVVHPCVDDVRRRLTTRYRGDNSGRRISNTYQVPKEEWTWKHGISSFYHAVGLRRSHIVSVASPHYRPKDHSLLEVNTPEYFRQNLETIAIIAKHRNILPVLCTMAFLEGRTPEYMAKGFSEHNNIVREFTDQEGIRVCDLKLLIESPEFFRNDGWHYTTMGVKYVAKKLSEFVV